jgi:phospholipid/cholesterol/gamma-HCH transport system substrate-binding protein
MGAQQQRVARRTLALGVLGIGVMAVILFVAGTAHSGLPFVTTTTVRAAFHDVHSLRVADDVRENSVRIGQVSEIEYRDDQALVTLRLEGDHDVYADAHAAILDLSALGTKFVQLSPGTAGAGPLGDRTIDAGGNSDSADIYHVFDVFDPPTLAAATSTVRELGIGSAGHGAGLHGYLSRFDELVPATGHIADVLASPQADLPGLLRATDGFATHLVGQQDQISQLIGRTDATLQAFTTHDAQPLSDTLVKLPATLDAARAALDDLSPTLGDTRRFMADFRPGAEDLGRSVDDVRGILRDGVPPLRQLPDVADDAEAPLTDLRDVSSDADPLSDRLIDTLGSTGKFLRYFGPYAFETRQLWSRGRALFAPNINGKHFPIATVVPDQRLAGMALRDGVPADPYPRPGQAGRERMGHPAGKAHR